MRDEEARERARGCPESDGRSEGVGEAEASAEADARAEEGGGKRRAKSTHRAITGKECFTTLEAFNEASRRDEKLTPAVQLVYRILMDKANRNYWQEGFICLLDELQEVTKMSRPTIVRARMVLKSKGYIDFGGKPTRYTIYSLVNQRMNPKVNRNGTPQTPLIKTVKEENKGDLGERKERKKEEAAADGGLRVDRERHLSVRNRERYELLLKLRGGGAE